MQVIAEHFTCMHRSNRTQLEACVQAYYGPKLRARTCTVAARAGAPLPQLLRAGDDRRDRSGSSAPHLHGCGAGCARLCCETFKT